MEKIMSMAQKVLQSPVTWSASTQYKWQTIQTAAAIGGGYTAVPMVIYNSVPYFALVAAPTLGSAPSSVPTQWGTLDSNNTVASASVTTTLSANHVLNVTSAVSILDLPSQSSFVNTITGTLISVNLQNDAYAMPGGRSYSVYLTAQGDTFAAAGNELQVSFQTSVDGGSTWQNVTPNAIASSVGIVASAAKGSAHTINSLVDFTSQLPATVCFIRLTAIVMQASQTCNISSANQFCVIVSAN